MATATNKSEVEGKNERELKHLGFVKIAAIQALVCVSNLYDFAKHNSGPLRSAVGTVEGTVTTVLGPIYHKFKDLPYHLLFFIDNRVDEATHKFDENAPPLVKQVAGQAKDLIQEVTNKAEKFLSEVQSGGPRAAAHYVAEESKQFALTGSVKLWTGLNRYQPFHTVAQMAVPAAANWSERYNQLVKNMSGKGYPVFGYLPLVPVEEISKAFKEGEGKVKSKEDEEAVPGSSDSD